MMAEDASSNPLLATAPIPVTAAEAEAFALAHFGVAGRARPLISERDQNFHISEETGPGLVLKIAHPAENAGITEFQTLGLLHIARKDPTLPSPRVRLTRDGQTSVRLEKAGEAPRTVRLLTFLPGAMLHQTPSSPALRRGLGALHARLGLALRGFEHPSSDYELLWDLKQAAGTRSMLANIDDPADRALLEQAMERFERHVAPALPHLRTQVVHNDLNAHNVVVDPTDPTRVTGILDFGDMIRSPLICDIAVAASYQFAVADGVLGGASDYLAGYHPVSPLLPDEIDLLADFILTRMMIAVLISTWRAQLYPENRQYILRNCPTAWAGLRRLIALPRDNARAAVMAACLGEASR